MNAQRRKWIGSVWDRLDELKLEIESIMEEEQGAFDNLPESLQSAERGEKMEEAIDNLSNSMDSIDEAISYLQSAIE